VVEDFAFSGALQRFRGSVGCGQSVKGKIFCQYGRAEGVVSNVPIVPTMVVGTGEELYRRETAGGRRARSASRREAPCYGRARQ